MSSARKYGRAHKAGQAMVESIFVMIFLFLAFYAVSQFADNFRAKLLVDYAASRVARARTVGMNDYMLEGRWGTPLHGRSYQPFRRLSGARVSGTGA